MKTRIRCAVGVALPLLLFTSIPASAVDKHWVCGNGSWSDGSCWSLTSGGAGGAGEPQPGERAILSQSVASDYTVSVASPDTGALTNILLQKTGAGTPELLHSSGTIQSNSLRIATAGIYTQTDGSLFVLQGDYTSDRNAGLLLGVFGGLSGSTSVFNLSGGLASAPYVSLGRSGAAQINHSGGTFTAGAIEFEGLAPSAYNLSGTAILDATDIDLGGNGGNAGVFSQTGGTNTVSNLLEINDASIYDLQAGSLSANTVTVTGNGTFNIGSTFGFSGLTLSGSAIINGGLNVDSGSAITVSGGTINGNLDVGSGSSGTATISGGTVNGSLTLGASGTASISNATVNNLLTLDGTVTSIGPLVADGGAVNNTSLTLSSTLTSNGAGLDNNASITLAGGTLDGTGALINDGTISGNGTIAGSGGFTNNNQLNIVGTVANDGGFTNDGVLTQGSGNLYLSGSGGSINNGTIDLAFNRELGLSNSDLTNHGVMNLRNTVVSGTAGLAVGSAGNVSGNGLILVDVNNAGTLTARSGNLNIAGSSFTNSGLVRNAVGSNLFIDATSVNHVGSIETNAAGAVVFSSSITNASGESVTLKGGTLSTPTLVNAVGGTVSGFGVVSGNLVNAGEIDLFGASTISGDLTNDVSGHVLVRNDTTLIAGHTINNGTLETLNGKMTFEGGLTNNGALLFDPSTLTISDLTVSSAGHLAETGDPGDRIIITGDMINQSTQNASWQTANTVFQFNGGSRDAGNPQLLEVAGADLGNTAAQADTNFMFGVLEIGTSGTYVKLVDDYDNSPTCLTTYCEIWTKEALYVGDLVLHAGTTLDLMGYNLYALNSFIDNGGTVINGSITIVGAVPLPAAAWLFGSGLVALVATAKRRAAA